MIAFVVVAGPGVHGSPAVQEFQNGFREASITSASRLNDCVFGRIGQAQDSDGLGLTARGPLSLVGHVHLTQPVHPPHRPRGHTASRSSDDAERVLHGWEVGGPGAVRDLRGAFAFGLWDERQRTLSLVRDQLGHRPLYYQVTKQGWIVASDRPEVVLAWPGTSQAVDVEAVVAQCLNHTSLLKTRTPYTAVSKLPAGHIATWRDGVVDVRRYWWPSTEPSQLAHKDLAAELRYRVEASVSDSVRGEATIGAHVSGGLDSSAVAVLAQRALADQGRSLTRAFSWSPPPTADLSAQDERARTQDMLARLGIPVTWTQMDADGLQATMRRGLEPSTADGLVHESWVARSAHEAGVEVLLSGWGGDEFASFNGRGALAGALRTGHLTSAASSMYRQAGRGGRSGALGAVSATRRLWGQGVRPLLPMSARSPTAGSPAAIYLGVLSKLHPSARAMLEEGTRWPKVGAAATQLALLDNGHLEHRLAAWAHLGDEHRIEYRYPLLDLRVVEFALTVPDAVHLAAPINRWLFRTAMSPHLPAELCWGSPKAEPAKFGAQLALLGEVPVVCPEGPAEAADIVERFFELRRELHQRLRAVL